MIYLLAAISLIADVVWIKYTDNIPIALNAQAISFFTLFLICMIKVYRNK